MVNWRNISISLSDPAMGVLSAYRLIVTVTSVWINPPRTEVALFNPRMPRPQQRPQLRLVTYKLTDRDDSFVTETGDVLSLLLHCPFSFIARLIPPMSVVNDFLISAANDQSMSGGGCTWKPFQLGDGEYRDLVSALKKRRFKSVIPPRWVRTHRDWGTWCGEIVWGVPVAKARRMKKRIAALEQEIEASDSSDEQVAKLLKKLMDMNAEWARYFSENCSRKPKIPLLRVPEKHGC